MSIASAVNILLAFYLVLLVKWSWVKRRLFFLIGVAAIAVDLLLGGIFGAITENWARIVAGIVGALCSLAALACAVGACYAGALPGLPPGQDQGAKPV